MESWVKFTAKDPRGQVWGFENKPWAELNGWAYEGRVEALDLTALPASVMNRQWQDSCIEVVLIGGLQLPLLDTEGGSAAHCATVLEAVSRVGVSAADCAAAFGAAREDMRERGSVPKDPYAFAGVPAAVRDALIDLGEKVSTPTKEQGVLDVQVGGDHYKTLGEYQPWQVAAAWLTPEELRGAMKFTVISYLAREQQKGGDQDIAKALHTMQIWEEVRK